METADRYVRDLIWAVSSPSLLGVFASLKQSENAAIVTRRLEADDIDRGHLRRYLTTHPERRVGRYFERLILYWLQYLRGCEIVAHSRQLRDGKRTVGEIDLLFHDEQARLTHWEVAVKFYLCVNATAPTAAAYVGPNVKDTLQRKTQRLIDHQLPLSARFFPEVEVRQAFVKGRIFYHWQSSGEDASAAELATNHLRGRWMRAADVPAYFAANRLHCRILKKPFWLAAEVAEEGDDDLFSPAQSISLLQTHFANSRRPVLISGFDERESPRRESDRLFVVHNQWPQS